MPATHPAPPENPAPPPARTFGTAALGLVVINALLFTSSHYFRYGILRSICEIARSSFAFVGWTWNQPSVIASGFPTRWTNYAIPFWHKALSQVLDSALLAVTLGSVPLILFGIAAGLGLGRVGQRRRGWWMGRFHAVVGFAVTGFILYPQLPSEWPSGAEHGRFVQVMDLLAAIISIPKDCVVGVLRSRAPNNVSTATLWLLLFTAEFLLCTRVLRRLRSAEPDNASVPA